MHTVTGYRAVVFTTLSERVDKLAKAHAQQLGAAFHALDPQVDLQWQSQKADQKAPVTIWEAADWKRNVVPRLRECFLMKPPRKLVFARITFPFSRHPTGQALPPASQPAPPVEKVTVASMKLKQMQEKADKQTAFEKKEEESKERYRSSLRDKWRCEEPRCPNHRSHCYVDQDAQHFKIEEENIDRWGNECHYGRTSIVRISETTKRLCKRQTMRGAPRNRPS